MPSPLPASPPPASPPHAALLLGALLPAALLAAASLLAGSALDLCLHPSLARAQTSPTGSGESERDREARARFELAQVHLDNGQFEDAGHEFRNAYELSGHAELLWNAYVAFRDAPNLPEAARALRDYLSAGEGLEPDRRRQLEIRLAALEREVENDDASTQPTPDPSEASEPVSEPRVRAVASRAEPQGGGLDPTIGIVVLSVGGATLLASLIEAIVAQTFLSERDDNCRLGPSGDLCPASYDQQEVLDRFTLHRDVAWGLLFAGAGVAAAGALLLALTGGQGDEERASGFSLELDVAGSPDGCVGFVRGTF